MSLHFLGAVNRNICLIKSIDISNYRVLGPLEDLGDSLTVRHAFSIFVVCFLSQWRGNNLMNPENRPLVSLGGIAR